MRATRALIHIDNLKHNFHILKAAAADSLFCAVVKADAYGHSIPLVAKALDDLGADRFGVACLEEAAAVRSCGITKPLHLFSACLPEEMAEAAVLDVIPFISSIREAALWNEAAACQTKPLTVHIKVDISMSRVGCAPEEAEPLINFIKSQPFLRLEGIATHFPNGDDLTAPRLEDDFAQFQQLIKKINDPRLIYHCANSAALQRLPASALNMVRQGLALYGYPPSDYVRSVMPAANTLRPVMELCSQITFIRKIEAGKGVSYGSLYRAPHSTYIAVVPCGYADGFFNSFSNRADTALVNGKRYPIAGFVCMDQLMIDLGPRPEADVYDKVVLFGPQPEANDAASLTRNMEHLSPYMLLTAISKRVPRVVA
jgi:alanine racemase